jgi:vacuolar-type H+-ATPase subunit E/Vma4
MALSDIFKKIEKETEEKIKKIEEEAKKEIEKIERKYQEEIEKRREKILNSVKEDVEKKIKHEEIKLSLETRNLILMKKREILDNLYQEILEELSKIDDKKYFDLILKLLKDCPDEGEIMPAKNREKITEEAIKKLNKKLVIKKSLPIKGGFIFSSKNLEIDDSFENLIRIIREKTEIEVAKILFG